MRARASSASGRPARVRATPGRPPAASASARACEASAQPFSPAGAPASRRPAAPAQPRGAREHGGQQGCRVIRAEHEAGGRSRLLQRLEQRVLGVEVETVRGRDDGHPKAALHGRQGQLGDEPLHLGDADLLAGPLRLDEVQVGVVAGCHLVTGGAGATGSRGRIIRHRRADRPPGPGRAWSCRPRAVPRPGGREAGARRGRSWRRRRAPPDDPGQEQAAVHGRVGGIAHG